MTSLAEQIRYGATELARADALPRLALSHPQVCALPPDCYRLWVKRIEKLSQPLQATVDLLPARKQALTVARSVAEERNTVESNNSLVRFGGQTLDFLLARHLAVAAYVTMTWTIYDRLANV